MAASLAVRELPCTDRVEKQQRVPLRVATGSVAAALLLFAAVRNDREARTRLAKSSSRPSPPRRPRGTRNRKIRHVGSTNRTERRDRDSTYKTCGEKKKQKRETLAKGEVMMLCCFPFIGEHLYVSCNFAIRD